MKLPITQSSPLPSSFPPLCFPHIPLNTPVYVLPSMWPTHTKVSNKLQICVCQSIYSCITTNSLDFKKPWSYIDILEGHVRMCENVLFVESSRAACGVHNIEIGEPSYEQTICVGLWLLELQLQNIPDHFALRNKRKWLTVSTAV
jgi:hypothetical protein